MASMPSSCEWVIVLDSHTINREAIEPFEQELRKTVGDPMLKVRRVDEGSAVLMVESSNEGSCRMQQIMRDRQDIEVGGTPIRQVFIGSIPLGFVQQIPLEEDFEHSPRSLPLRLSLEPDLP